MNITNFTRVLDHIKAHPVEWDQSRWGGNTCCTAYCIAGHSQRLAGKKPDDNTVWSDAKAWLGIAENEAWYLFDMPRTIADFEAALANETGKQALEGSS